VASLDEIRAFLAEEFPQSPVTVDEAAPMRSRVRHPIGEAHLRPGRTVAGPVLMFVADAGAYAAILGTVGIVPHAVTTNLTIAFLRRPSADRAIVGEGKLLKLGKRLAFAEVTMFSEGDPEPVAHATVTYALPTTA
jgi:acyl-coenzyme A thioesterase PaaI-like protein